MFFLFYALSFYLKENKILKQRIKGFEQIVESLSVEIDKNTSALSTKQVEVDFLERQLRTKNARIISETYTKNARKMHKNTTKLKLVS